MYHHCKVKHILRWYFFDVVADWVINVYDKDAVRRILSSKATGNKSGLYQGDLFLRKREICIPIYIEGQG